MLSFLTGSRQFGYATRDSDIDLVIYTDEATKQTLEDHSENRGKIKYGSLNIIAVSTPEEYAAWLLSKIQCIKYNVQNKKESILTHDRVREMFDLEYSNDSGACS